MYESQFVYLRVAMGGPLSLSHVLLSSGRVPFIQAVGSEIGVHFGLMRTARGLIRARARAADDRPRAQPTRCDRQCAPPPRPLADATACTPRFPWRGFGSHPHPRPARPCLRPLQGRHRMGATAGLAMRALAAPERGARPPGCCLPALPACLSGCCALLPGVSAAAYDATLRPHHRAHRTRPPHLACPPLRRTPSPSPSL